MAAMLSMVLHWPGLPWVLASMLVFGASLSVYDVAINTEGSVLETAGGRPIMGSLHGVFSVGAMAGAALASGLLRAGVPATWQLSVVAVLVALCILVGSRWMLPTPAPSAKPEAHFTWPRGALLIMGLLTFPGMSAEGVMFDWRVLVPPAGSAHAARAGGLGLLRLCRGHGGDAICRRPAAGPP